VAGPLRLVTQAFCDRPALEVGVSRAVLDRVGRRELGPTFRLARTAPTLSFGRLDAVVPGFGAAVAAARAQGFFPVHRLSGGRAAVWHEGTLAFGHAVAEDDPRAGTHERFAAMADLLAGALRDLGLDAQVGELAREYCPGAYSIHLGGRVKVVGIAQRVTARAAYTEGMVVVDGGARVRDVLVPVYDALGLDWDPATAGACDDDRPGLRVEEVEAAIVARLRAAHEVERADALDPETLALGERHVALHDATLPDPRGRPAAGAHPKVA
jgi:lipoate-protein ligase A